MDSTIKNCCVCRTLLQKCTRLIEMLDHLECLVKIDYTILEESLICDICLEKVQSAYRFKTAHLESSKIKLLKENDCLENCIICTICSHNVYVNECSSLVNSSGPNLNLIRYLSEKLEPNNSDSQICESCQKSLINFYFVISMLLSNFNPDRLYQVNDCMNRDLNFKIEDELKLELSLQNLKEEPQDNHVKEESQDDHVKEELLLKNEEIDLIMDCDEEILDDRIQQRHERENRQNSLLSDFNHCKNVSINELNQHIHIQKNPNNIVIFKCQLCEYSTKYKHDLKKHIITHKNSDEVEMFKCQICDFETKYKKSIVNHMLTHDKKKMYCELCDYETTSRVRINKHKFLHMIFKCKICEYETKSKIYLTKHMRGHTNPNEVEMFKCHLCEYSTKYKYCLKIHIITHKNSDEVEMFECKICEFKSKYKTSIKKHMVIHKNSNEIKMYKCQICDFETKYKKSIGNHMLTHDEKKFYCELCDYETTSRSHINNHEFVHRQEKMLKSKFL